MSLQPIIGLEIHVRINTKSKMFCRCKNMADDDPPNTAICSICTAQPGTLPVLNQTALEKGILMALALNCEIPAFSKFDRKNYFYPDLPKGYQISQYDQPVSVNGWLEFEVPSPKGTYRKKVRITRLHLEEDAGKLIHRVNHPERAMRAEGSLSFVDFNRCGSPLMEIVTEPDFRTAGEAKAFLQELQRIARAVNVSEADMEKGHMRCDANISLRELRVTSGELRNDDDIITDYSKLSPKTEVKNINSFKAVERALEYETIRQTKLWSAGTPVNFLSTRGWDDAKGITVDQRIKEEAHDYRYFPEPDLPPLTFTPEWVEELRRSLPELPEAKRMRLMEEYGFGAADVGLFVDLPHLADFVEKVMSELTTWIKDTEEPDSTKALAARTKLAKLAGGWIGSKLLGVLNQEGLTLTTMKLDAENFAELITMIASTKINSTNAVQLITHMVKAGGDPSQLLEEQGLTQVSDESALQPIIQTVVDENPKVVADVKSGKTQALQFLVGQVMKKTKGTANPEVVRSLLIDQFGIES